MRRVYYPEYNPSMSDYARKSAQEGQGSTGCVRLTSNEPYRSYRSRAWAEEQWGRLTAKRQATHQGATY